MRGTVAARVGVLHTLLLARASAQGTCPEAAPTTGAALLWTELESRVCDPNSILACCPSGWQSAPEVGDFCYYFSDVEVSFAAAEAACDARDAQMLHIMDSTQQDFIAQQLGLESTLSGSSQAVYYWLGMHSDASGLPSSLEWTDGRRSSYIRPYASSAAPGSQLCATISSGSCAFSRPAAACTSALTSGNPYQQGEWDMVRCETSGVDRTERYICQRPSGHARAYTTWTNYHGTAAAAGDDGWIDVALPFPFPFFGETFHAGDLIRVSANGYITFGAASSHHFYGSTSSIPSPESPNAVIAAYWTDLYPAGVTPPCPCGGLFSLMEADRLVIEWREVPYWIPNRDQGYCSNPANFEICSRTATFEMVLHRDGSVQILYLECDDLPGRSTGDFPDHAPLVVGFENMDGSSGVEIIPRSHTTDMTGLVVSIPQSCHDTLPYCAARTLNASAACVPPAGSGSGSGASGASGGGGDGWVRVDDAHSGVTYYHVSWHWGPTFALLMSFIVSGWRLYKVVTRGHIWRGHWISVENDLATVQAMLAAARAGGRGIGAGGGAAQNNALSSAEMDSIVRLTTRQLREPVAVQQQPRADTTTTTPESSPPESPPPESSTATAGFNSLSSPESVVPVCGDEASEASEASEAGEAIAPQQPQLRMPNFGNEMCAVCMCSMLEPDVEATGTEDEAPSLMQLTCTHVFHTECVEPWLRMNRECPICKRDAVHGDGSADREAAAAALMAEATLGDSSSDDDADTVGGTGGGGGGGITDVDRAAARRAIGALGGYRSCDRSTFVVCLACVTGLFITTVSEISYVRHCKVGANGNHLELDLRCGFFVAISLVSFAMASVAVAALHTPVRGRCLWDGFSGWCLYSFTIISICSSWYDKILAAHVSGNEYGEASDRDGSTYVRTDEQREDVCHPPPLLYCCFLASAHHVHVYSMDDLTRRACCCLPVVI
jgi:hypothetical protein